MKIYSWEDAVDILEDIVKRITFCKNCRFASHDTNHPKLWLCSNSNWYKTDSDFCSKGEKRAKDTKEFEK